MTNREMAVQSPSAEIEEIWRHLWHCDVKKDHPELYDRDIVNTLLPGRGLERPELNKEVLFNSVLGNAVYEHIFTDPIFMTTDQYVNSIYGKRYKLRTFDIPITPEQCRQIGAFMGDQPYTLFIDTANHTDELIKNIENLRYAYTRATESDAAGKMNLSKSDDVNYLNKLYYEDIKPGATQHVTYPDYTVNTRSFGLSHFFCKYPVTLSQFSNVNITNPRNRNLYGKLIVKMEYTNNGRNIEIEEGANQATGRKQKNKQMFILNVRSSGSEKELTFLSKHHGDIAQVLDKNRTIPLINYATKTASVFDQGRSCFVSIDINAITKAFTIGMDSIWFYSNTSNKLCVFTTENPADEMRYLLEYLPKFVQEITGMTDSLLIQVREYNSHIDDLKNRRSIFLRVVEAEFNAIPENTQESATTANYIECLKLGLRIAALCNYVPKVDIQPIPEDMINDSKSFLQQIKVNGNLEELKTITSQLKYIKEQLLNIQDLIIIPPHLLTAQIFNGGKLAITSHEKNLMFQVRQGGLVSLKTVDNGWAKINIEINPIARGFSTFFCGIGSKYNERWGLDLVSQAYRNIKNYNENVSNYFIEKLRRIVSARPPQLEWLNNGLGLIGLNLPAPTRGGRWNKTFKKGGMRTHIKTSKPSKTSKHALHTPKKTKTPQKTLSKLTSILSPGKHGNTIFKELTPRVYNTQDSYMSNSESQVPLKLFTQDSVSTQDPIYTEDIIMTQDPISSVEVIQDPVVSRSHNDFLHVLQEEVNDIGAVVDFYTKLEKIDSDNEEIITELYKDFFNKVYNDNTAIVGGDGTLGNLFKPIIAPDIFDEGTQFFMSGTGLTSYEDELTEIEMRLHTLSTKDKQRLSVDYKMAYEQLIIEIERIRRSLDLIYNNPDNEEIVVAPRGGKRGKTYRKKPKKSKKKTRYTNRTYKK